MSQLTPSLRPQGPPEEGSRPDAPPAGAPAADLRPEDAPTQHLRPEDAPTQEMRPEDAPTQEMLPDDGADGPQLTPMKGRSEWVSRQSFATQRATITRFHTGDTTQPRLKPLSPASPAARQLVKGPPSPAQATPTPRTGAARRPLPPPSAAPRRAALAAVAILCLATGLSLSGPPTDLSAWSRSPSADAAPASWLIRFEATGLAEVGGWQDLGPEGREAAARGAWERTGSPAELLLYDEAGTLVGEMREGQLRIHDAPRLARSEEGSP